MKIKPIDQIQCIFDHENRPVKVHFKRDRKTGIFMLSTEIKEALRAKFFVSFFI